MFNYRHPGPRRVWKGGSEQQPMIPDPDPCRACRAYRAYRRVPFGSKLLFLQYLVTQVTLRCNAFLLFRDLSSKTHTVESFLGGCPARNVLKSRYFSQEVHEKVQKTSRRSVTRVTKYYKKQQICTIWRKSTDPADPPDQVSSTAARTPLPRAPGAKMT